MNSPCFFSDHKDFGLGAILFSSPFGAALKQPIYRNNVALPLFVKAILLDTLFRYPFIDLKQIEKRGQDQAVKLWAEVMGRLSRVYFEVRSLGFEYSALGLFSEINRIGGCMNSLKPNQEKYDFLIRTWDDMADADSVNFALLGKDQQQVHIVTLEKKIDIERRLICLADNLRDMETRGFKTNFYPGTVTIFSPTFEEVDFFSVQEVISRRCIHVRM